MEYRVNFIIGAASTVAFQAAGLLTVWVVMSQIPDLNGPAANIGPVESSIRSQPQTTAALAAAAATRASRSGQPSVAEQLVARLNPFAAATKPRGARP